MVPAMYLIVTSAIVATKPTIRHQHTPDALSGSRIEEILGDIPGMNALRSALPSLPVGLSAKMGANSKRDSTRRYFAYLHEQPIALSRSWARRMRAPEVVHTWLDVWCCA